MGNNIYIGRLFAIQEMLNITVKRDRNVCNYIGIKASNIFISRCAVLNFYHIRRVHLSALLCLNMI